MYDFLIIGQGIAGSVLAWHLLKAGKTVVIVDDAPPLFLSKSASKIVHSAHGTTLLKYADFMYPKIKAVLGDHFKPKVIGGLITPITGKRFVKTWLADILLPYAKDFYYALEKELSISFYTALPIVRLFANARQANDISVRRTDSTYKNYFIEYNFENDQVKTENGYAVLDQGAVVDGIEMLSALHRYFKNREILINASFDSSDLIFKSSHVEWENTRAKSVIFCEGWKAVNNPFLKYLPFLPAKGELLIIKSEKLKLKELLNRGIFIRPLNGDLYLVGSTYSWNDLSLQTTQTAREEIEEKLKTVIKSNYTVIEQLAGIRPTVQGRRPFMGKLQHNENMYVFNGLGTKGLLLAPYFSNHLCQYLLAGQPLLPEVDIYRFRK